MCPSITDSLHAQNFYMAAIEIYQILYIDLQSSMYGAFLISTAHALHNFRLSIPKALKEVPL